MPSTQREQVDVVILTVISTELEAARRVLELGDDSRERDPEGTIYFRGAVSSSLNGRNYRIALSCIGGAGNPGAAAAAASAIARYRPRALLLMGIAAGIRDKIRIGEVVLSDRVVAYEPAALVRSASGTHEQPRPEIDRAPHAMLQDVASYRPDAARLRAAFERAGGAIPAAPAGREEEFRVYVASSITARQGTIASGEKLLRDPAKLLAVREQHGKIEAGEMEAAGIVDACRRGPIPWLVIRGISDFGDEFKDDHFHGFAAAAAAAVLHDFLAHGLDLGPAMSEAHAINPAVPPPTAPPPRPNPFVFGRAIDRDEDFIGRDEERRWLRDAIDKRQPVQLLGERLMGKSSLLRWVQRALLPDRPVIWLDPSRGITPVSMVQSIARALGKPEAAAVLDHPDATPDQAGRVLDALVPFVLLVDDADALCSRGRGFDDAFFAAVRALVERGALTWVSASQRDLYEAFRAKGLTSSFLLGTSKFEIGPLSQTAAIELTRRGLGEDAAARLVSVAGGFAYGLQWLGDFACRQPGALDEACDAFADDVAPTFQLWWTGVDAHDRQLVKRCLSSDVTVTGLDDRSRRRLRSLKKRGLVAEQNGRFIIEGAIWRDFVINAD